MTIDVYRNNLAVVLNLPFVGDPTIQVDSTAAIRRSGTFTIADEDGTLTPKMASDHLSPFGSELRIRSGWTYSDGTTEQIPVAVLRVTAAETADVGSITLTAQDRATVVTEARFEVPWVVAAGTALDAAIYAIVARTFPGVTFTADSSAAGIAVPLTVYEEGDRSGNPWQNCQDLAAAYGYETFFAPDGSLVLRVVPNPLTSPSAWDYSPGADALLIAAANQMSSQSARNVAIAIGEGPNIAVPIRSSREITDPASPLYPPSFGYRSPVFFASPLLDTQAKCDQAATSLLQRHAGGSELLGFTAAPHVAHDAGDVVRVADPVLAGGEAFVVLRSFAMPITSRGAVTYATNARRTS